MVKSLSEPIRKRKKGVPLRAPSKDDVSESQCVILSFNQKEDTESTDKMNESSPRQKSLSMSLANLIHESPSKKLKVDTDRVSVMRVEALVNESSHSAVNKNRNDFTRYRSTYQVEPNHVRHLVENDRVGSENLENSKKHYPNLTRGEYDNRVTLPKLKEINNTDEKLGYRHIDRNYEVEKKNNIRDRPQFNLDIARAPKTFRNPPTPKLVFSSGCYDIENKYIPEEKRAAELLYQASRSKGPVKQVGFGGEGLGSGRSQGIENLKSNIEKRVNMDDAYRPFNSRYDGNILHQGPISPIPHRKKATSKHTKSGQNIPKKPASSQRVCASCKVSSTPCWRPSWDNILSLCNSCGLRYKKGGVYCFNCHYVPMKTEISSGKLLNCKRCSQKINTDSY
ncbi:Transcriptional regulatory protein ASH1 [Zancudomyces culisetae]|uniref:Transcriptional regulatory protein ASH1 n=1 Tax=Zancudomyces culisetae TaxID=1213189 RepID=A0A1R1PW60_ZANCU|nr:Transcriptional regulatory protein ASH1 [Zancudomyces culisetae]|eukprot:OMH85206.1 Transcriptional regulatory protein ASH1 [Zancudomyces culisetae]